MEIDRLNVNGYDSLEYNIMFEIRDDVLGNDVIHKEYKCQFKIINTIE
ncbi:MAG: hypothetical protein PHS24_01170 [Bacilli bacterium]|nr:hypothetical protein [Bacilli bacterium]